MKRIFLNRIAIFLSFFVVVFSCDVTKDIENFEVEVEDREIEFLDIPEGFDFRTHKEVLVTINDNENFVKYDVFAYSDEKYFAGIETYENEEGVTVTDSVFKSGVLDNLIFTGAINNGKLSQIISLPNHFNKLYIRRKEGYKYSASIESVYNNEVNFNYTDISGKNSLYGKNQTAGVTDYLYCVNGSAELFQVDPLTGSLVYLSDMPMGSYTCAIDQENKVLYSIGRSNPHPLMKYSIEDNTWETVANYRNGGPRLDFNPNDGLLYFSTGDKLYTINTDTGQTVNTWDINGLHLTAGGDLAFAEDGTLYLCSFSGLYSLELDQNNVYQASRISADNLPFNPTSMTFDSNQELWLASNGGSSDLIVMDTVTGGWQINWGAGANNNSNFGRTINDLTTFRVYSDVIDQTDTDNDGIIDVEDEFPNDSEKAFEVFTPSKYGWGTLAFEDLWPYTGDYDFNDVALNYKCIAILNAQNLAVQLDFIYTVKANGAGFKNGFGFEIENLSPSLVESVTGAVLNEGYINISANGTESGQDNAVIIPFDNVHAMVGQETTVSIKFTQPISTNVLGVAPFNPFIIVNAERAKEVHLPTKNPTSLGDNLIQVQGGFPKDADGNYLSDTGLPWAINVVHDFKVPKEGIRVNEAYNYFNQWATSGGASKADWYKDNPGHRNLDKIKN
ncbi:LruC domain-containing protein [Seonamhaeicola sp. ML3]|uniref:LruC domain-containing protein n=1 Tax=Seonamhaeicola sp. ML3 TaxID=2937786 RepID=UPI00200FA4A3|nr:LruC domain-containing protein [Seonamhaeicola sp. ML3]